MTDKIKVAISGISGAMGRTIAGICASDASFEIVGALDRPDSPLIGTKESAITINADAKIACANADVLIDFTTPMASINALKAIQNTNVKAVIIGTTGFTAAQNDDIKSGNFSLGVNLLAGLVARAAAILGDDWDIEIVEAHHRRKIDAPSGTAILLGEAAAKGRGGDLSKLRLPAREGITGARPQGGIGFSAIRGGSLIGEHDVRFESDSESIILTHKAHDRSIFAKGAIAAAKWAIGQKNGLYDMGDVLGN
ncbi:MAG: dihydrodipicolinate reductase [Hyphomonadaceae bacterium]|nr:MAG: dihydrodipicolinate reductase [Hyphomonadaceae bacterium]